MLVQKMRHVLRPWFAPRRGGTSSSYICTETTPQTSSPKREGSRKGAVIRARGWGSRTRLHSHDSIESRKREHNGIPSSTVCTLVLIGGTQAEQGSYLQFAPFCDAIAALKLACEEDLDVSVFLSGGCFAIPADCVGKNVLRALPDLACLHESCSNPREGGFVLIHPGKDEEELRTSETGTASTSPGTRGAERNAALQDETLLQVPRTLVMKLSRRGSLEIPDTTIAHGETETRFVAAFNTFVQPHLAYLGWEEDNM